MFLLLGGLYVLLSGGRLFHKLDPPLQGLVFSVPEPSQATISGDGHHKSERPSGSGHQVEHRAHSSGPLYVLPSDIQPLYEAVGPRVHGLCLARSVPAILHPPVVLRHCPSALSTLRHSPLSRGLTKNHHFSKNNLCMILSTKHIRDLLS